MPHSRSPLANRFLGTVRKRGLTNPYALAALYATGKHESSWAPENVYGEWGDPSESGKPGRAGGALSWRSERLDNLRKFAQSRGDDPRRPAIETQAEFFLNEDPSLIEALQGAKNETEAQRIMNNAWRFAGYDRRGGEAARRLQTARQTLGELLSGEGGTSSLAGSAGSNGTEDEMAIRTSAPGGFSGGYGAANRLGQALSQSARPAAASPALPAPLKGSPNRSDMLAWVLENMEKEAKQPNPRTAPEALLRALGTGMKGYIAGNAIRDKKAEEQRKLDLMADMLAGKNPELAELARQGVLGMDSLGSAVVESAFKEPKQKKPIEIAGRLVDPDTYEVIKDFSEEKSQKPIVVNGRIFDPNTREVLADFSDRKTKVVNHRLVDASDGTVLADLRDPESYTMSPGDVRFRGDEPIASVPDRPAKPSDREQRVQMLTETGVPEDIAKGIAAGRFVVSRHPTSEVAQVVDKATGKVVFDGIPADAAAAQPGAGPAGAVPQGAEQGAEQEVPTYIPENVDPAQATGGSGFVGGIVNQVADMFGQGLPYPEIEEAAEALTTTRVLTASLLQAEVPGRPSQHLMERLEELTVEPKSLFRADERARTRLQQTRDLINEEVARIENDVLSKPHQFKPGEITKARLNSSQLKSLLRAYDAMLTTTGRRREENRPPLDQFKRR